MMAADIRGDETEARLRALLTDAGDLLDGARCSLSDPALRMAWGRRRRDLLDAINDLGADS